MCALELRGEKGLSRKDLRVHRFALVSGVGWCIDLGMMSGLVALCIPTFFANLVGASLAISFVFLVSQRRIFIHDGHVLGRQFLYYCLWQAAAVPLASLAIASLAPLIEATGLLQLLPIHGRVIAPVIAKALVTPVTLYSNYLFMSWLLERRLAWY
ncbi:GtrA family protein [Nitrospirillum sp. BR 11752]|uniref:GtrA family protein n=1 Tax=Nitrospirillum sp. BR 11752 TaxID=3104293 RepID=UPI002EB2E9A9|nr:GtrA family protein [Nitrospirillum sp. BR 11752]